MYANSPGVIEFLRTRTQVQNEKENFVVAQVVYVLYRT